MSYIPAKTDVPTDLKALWISFGDSRCSKKNDSHGYDLSFNRSSRRGECGLNNNGMCLWFPIFCSGCCGEKEWVVDIAEIPVPTVIDKLFFEMVARLIQYACYCNPEYSVEEFDWYWSSFHENIFVQIECTSNWLWNWVIQSQIELCTQSMLFSINGMVMVMM